MLEFITGYTLCITTNIAKVYELACIHKKVFHSENLASTSHGI